MRPRSEVHCYWFSVIIKSQYFYHEKKYLQASLLQNCPSTSYFSSFQLPFIFICITPKKLDVKFSVLGSTQLHAVHLYRASPYSKLFHISCTIQMPHSFPGVVSSAGVLKSLFFYALLKSQPPFFTDRPCYFQLRK